MANPRYYSAFCKKPRKPTPSGSRYAKTYVMEIDANGHKILREDGLTDTYERIQSFLEETKIENIITRAEAGDMSGLMVGNAQFLDFRDAPATLAEAQNLIIKIEQEFEKLPLEVRAKFDHSPEKYISTYGSEGWNQAMQLGPTAQVVQGQVTNTSEENNSVNEHS